MRALRYVAVFLVLCGCGGAARVTARPRSVPAPPAPIEQDVPLGADEARIRDGLTKHYAALHDRIGERHVGKPWELASAADYVALELEALGYALERIGEEVDGVPLQTLAVTVTGGARGNQVLVVGARYDSPRDDRGSGEAAATGALLELARLLRGARPSRAIRLVLFPHAASEPDPARRSSARFVRDWVRPPSESEATSVVGFLELGRLAGEVRRPLRYGASPGAETLAGLVVEGLSGPPLVLLECQSSDYDADSRAFQQKSVPTLWLDQGADGPPGTSFDASTVARVVHRLRFGLASVTGEEATNDGMLTPDQAAVR